jgi:hypothetical protein
MEHDYTQSGRVSFSERWYAGPVVHALIGRDFEIAQLNEALERMLQGRGALLLLAGEPGIGKTALVEVLAEDAVSKGARVVWGRCWEASGGAPPFWPWTEVFRGLGLDDPFIDARAATAEAADVRFIAFDRACETLRSAALERPTLLVLDDVHAADVSSLLFLLFVARALRKGARLGIAATYREREASTDPEVFATLQKIAREGKRLTLARLSKDEIATWIRRERRDVPDVAIERVFDRSDGNPLFVRELLHVRTSLDAGETPAGLTQVLDEHLARVPKSVRALLSVASVLGRDTTLADWAALAESSVDAVATEAGAAIGAGVLAAREHDRYAFRHVLLRDRLYAGLLPSERFRLHARAGEHFRARGAVALAAYHLLEAASPDGPPVALDAARRALDRLAFEEAAQIATRALEATGVTREATCELTLVLAEAQIRGGEGAMGQKTALRAVELAGALSSPELVARAALAHGAELASGTMDVVQIEILRSAKTALEAKCSRADDPLRAQVLARLASAMVPPRDAEDMRAARDLADEALAMARRIGDADTLLYVLRFALSAKTGSFLEEQRAAPREDRHALITELLAVARARGRPLLLLDNLAYAAGLARERGAHDVCARSLEELAVLSSELGGVQYQWQLPLALSVHAMLDGDFDRSDAHAADALRRAEDAGSLPGMMGWAINRISMLTISREPKRIAEHDAKLWTLLQKVGARMKHMKRILRPAVDEGDPLPNAVDLAHLPLALLTGDAALATGDFDYARTALPALIAHSDAGTSFYFWGSKGGSVMGPLPRVAAEVLMLLGRRQEARAHFERGIASALRLRSPPLVERMKRGLEAVKGPTVTTGPSRSPLRVSMVRDGDLWHIASSSGQTVTLKDSLGLRYLAELISNPEREFHVMDLVGAEGPANEGLPVLDAKAKAAYKERLDDLRERLAEARAHGNIAAAERAEAEIEALSAELSAAIGIGGRDRKTGGSAERARINVQRPIRDVVKKVQEEAPELGRYLEAATKTGNYCVFRPI